jgi:hypothetical protein
MGLASSSLDGEMGFQASWLERRARIASGIILALSTMFAVELYKEGIKEAGIRTLVESEIVKLPSAPDEVTLGEIVLVSGKLTAEPPVLLYGEPAFNNVFKVQRQVKYQRNNNFLSESWAFHSNDIFVGHNAKIGPWELSSSVLNAPQAEGAQQPELRNYFPGDTIKYGMENAVFNRNTVEFDAKGERFQIIYTTYPTNQFYTVLAMVGNKAILLPVNRPEFQIFNESFLLPGQKANLSFLDERVEKHHQDGMLNVLYWFSTLPVIMFLLGRWIGHTDYSDATLDALWQSLALSVPFAVMTFWPTSSFNFVLVFAIACGGIAGVLILIIGYSLFRRHRIDSQYS